MIGNKPLGKEQKRLVLCHYFTIASFGKSWKIVLFLFSLSCYLLSVMMAIKWVLFPMERVALTRRKVSEIYMAVDTFTVGTSCGGILLPLWHIFSESFSCLKKPLLDFRAVRGKKFFAGCRNRLPTPLETFFPLSCALRGATLLFEKKVGKWGEYGASGKTATYFLILFLPQAFWTRWSLLSIRLFLKKYNVSTCWKSRVILSEWLISGHWSTACDAFHSNLGNRWNKLW